MGDVDAIAVFDAVSRLVDKNLVAVDERPGGEQRYRLLETLRLYALDRARAADELSALRDAHVTFWLDWLESQEPVLHTDRVIERVELFHDSLSAALDWSTREPALGLHLLRRLARSWQGSGRPDVSLSAVDALLTEENAARFPVQWAAAAGVVFVLVGTARSWPEAIPLLVRGRALALEAGEEYWVAASEWLLDPSEEALDVALAALVCEVPQASGVVARGERKRPSHGWAALTPTEQQVVALVAEGLTNPQIAERLLMGRATVKTHLDHVFAKTGLHSRTELAAEVVRRNLGPSG
jgi:DNA-binding CsgD family transcriptional regulator